MAEAFPINHLDSAGIVQLSQKFLAAGLADGPTLRK
jgi:hypothetical protein